MKSILLVLSVLLSTLGNGQAESLSKENPNEKTVIIDIPSDLPPPASAEETLPNHPFFAAPSPANEVMEKLQELEDRVNKIEKQVSALETGKKL